MKDKFFPFSLSTLIGEMNVSRIIQFLSSYEITRIASFLLENKATKLICIVEESTRKKKLSGRGRRRDNKTRKSRTWRQSASPSQIIPCSCRLVVVCCARYSSAW